MKWHFNFFRFAVMCAAFVALAGFMACSDDDSESGPELVLSASTSSLAGGGSVTFTVAFEDRDVTAEAVIKNVTSGSEVQNATWTTNVAGTYEFQAAYDGMLSNVVSVKVESDSESDAFYRHVLLTKFTATWCGPCASAQSYFEQLEPAESERFLVVAAHQGDRLAVSVGERLALKLKYRGVPTWNYNFATAVSGVGPGGITVQSIRNQIKSTLEKYPAVCGVRAESELDGLTAKVRATVMFQQAGNYKIACVLTENDIQKTNNETLPVFNHVLRAALTNMEGDPIAPAVAEAGERSFDFEVTLNNGWDSRNCEFVIYVFKEEEDAAFIVNNGAVCPVGGKVDYKYESVE